LDGINLFSKNLTGVLPADVGLLKSLTKFYVYGSPMLSGTMPFSIAELTNMGSFSIGYCNFSGSLPDGIGESWPNLKVFVVSSNKFGGALDNSIRQWTNLEDFQVRASLV
jgi:hypothetical protein